MDHSHERSSAVRGDRSKKEASALPEHAPENPVLASRGLTMDGLGNRALLSLSRSASVQRKARLSERGDPLEREADRAAEAVMAAQPTSEVLGDRPALSVDPSAQTEVSVPHRQVASDRDIHRMPTDDEELANTLGLGSREKMPAPETTTGASDVGPLFGGRSLDERTRSTMESRFGESFGDVRIHSGPDAGEAAESLRSRAFTVGDDIVFAAGEFAPETTEGQRLLAHELAHVVQQRGPAGSAPAGERDTERDAHEAADEVERGGTPRVHERAEPGTVQKQPATTKPTVATSTTTMTSEASGVVVTVEGRQVAGGRTSSFDHPHDDGGLWDQPSRTLTLRVSLERFGTLQASTNASIAARDLGISTIVIIPVIDGVEESPIVIAPAPPRVIPPAPKVPTPKPPPSRKIPQTVEPESVDSAPDVVPASQRTVQSDLPTLREHLKARASDVDALGANLSDTDMSQLLPSERTQLLQTLAGTNESARANQNTLLRLLTTTRQDEARDVLNALRADDARLTQQLVAGFDWIHARALHQALQLLYNTSMFNGLTATDLEATPIVPWPSSTIHFDDIELTPAGRVRFRVRQDAKDPLPFSLDLDPFAPVRTRPQGDVFWLGQRRYAVTPSINLFGLGDPQLQMLMPTRDDIGRSPLSDLFGARAPSFPLFGNEDFLTRFIQAPTPTRPIVPLTPALRARVTTIIDSMNSMSPFSDRDINEAFKDAAPDEFQQIHDALGPARMAKLFGQLSPFDATLVGSYGPVEYGRVELNDKRAEFMLSTRNWGAPKATFYQWMFDTMSNDDIRSVLQRVAHEKRLADTVLSVPGLAENLKARGVDVKAIPQDKLSVSEGAQSGVEGLWSSAWTGTVFGSGPGFEHTYLPPLYQSMYLGSLSQQWNQTMTPGNMARGVASYSTLGFTDIPIGVYETGKASVEGISDIVHGKSGEGTEKLVPAVVMVLAVVLGRKLAARKPATAGAASELAAGESKGFTLPNYKGPKSSAAARVEATLNANPAAAAAGAELVDTLGAETIEKAAGYIQENSAAVRFVAKNGVPGVSALVAANGDVAAAAAALEGRAPNVPKQLPPPRTTPTVQEPGVIRGQDVWEEGRQVRGLAIEHWMGKLYSRMGGAVRRLPKNFKGLDFVFGGTTKVLRDAAGRWIGEVIEGATGINERSVDLRKEAKGLPGTGPELRPMKTGQEVRTAIRSHVNKMYEFEAYTLEGIEVKDVKGKILNVSIGPGWPTPEQIAGITAAIEDAKVAGVMINVTVFPPP